MERPPRPVYISVLDFEATHRALKDFAGCWIGLEALALRASGPFAILTGRLGAVYILGRPGHRVIAFQLGEAALQIAEASFARAVREQYVDSNIGLRWELIAIEFEVGVALELEEIPSVRVS